MVSGDDTTGCFVKNYSKIVDVVTIVASLCVVSIAIILGWKLLRDSPQIITVPDRTIVHWRSYAEHGHWMGAEDAPVVIVEFGDYECPACRAVAPHLDAVRAAFPQQVALVYRHLPLEYHHLAYPAARAAECASLQGKFEAFHVWLYHDAGWMANPRGRFASFAAEIGMPDLERFESCLDDLGPVASIERDIAAAGELEAHGTPTILVNDLLLGSFADSLTLTALIEAALEAKF